MRIFSINTFAAVFWVAGKDIAWVSVPIGGFMLFSQALDLDLKLIVFVFVHVLVSLLYGALVSARLALWVKKGKLEKAVFCSMSFKEKRTFVADEISLI